MKKLLLVCSLIFILTGCSVQKKDTSVEKTSFLLNTISTITIYNMKEKEAAEIINSCFAICRDYENKLSKTIEKSDVWSINHSGGNWVEAGDDAVLLLSMSKEYSSLSEGKFDLTIEPVTNLWNFTSETPSVPSKNALEETVKHVNWENIEINGNNVRLKDPKASIDLGGIAKGYIGDKARDFLIEKGVKKAIINLGGNVLTINPDSEDTFRIGIKKPFEDRIFGVLTVNNQSVVTSGNYERYFIENNKIYHHILDPQTGMPIDNGVYSATIITENSAKADALSTTCFILGIEKGLALIEAIPNTEAIFINDKYEFYATSGIGKTVEFKLN